MNSFEYRLLSKDYNDNYQLSLYAEVSFTDRIFYNQINYKKIPSDIKKRLTQILEKNEYMLYQSNIMNAKKANEERMYCEEKGQSEVASRMNSNEIVWLVKYNNGIIVSKLNYIFEEMSKKYKFN